MRARSATARQTHRPLPRHRAPERGRAARTGVPADLAAAKASPASRVADPGQPARSREARTRATRPRPAPTGPGPRSVVTCHRRQQAPRAAAPHHHKRGPLARPGPARRLPRGDASPARHRSGERRHRLNPAPGRHKARPNRTPSHRMRRHPVRPHRATETSGGESAGGTPASPSAPPEPSAFIGHAEHAIAAAAAGARTPGRIGSG